MDGLAEAAVFLGLLAALAVMVLAIRWFFLIRRLHRLADQVSTAVAAELSEAVRAWRVAAESVQRSAGKLDQGLNCLARTLDRFDRMTENLETGSFARTLMAPTVLKVAAWLGGLQRGLSSSGGPAAANVPRGGLRANAGPPVAQKRKPEVGRGAVGASGAERRAEEGLGE